MIKLLRNFRDPLYRNTLYLLLASIFGAVLGFAFWWLAARYYTTETVGLAASIISLASFLGSLSTLGLGTGLVRFLPSMESGISGRINSSLTLSALVALCASVVFLVGLDLWAPAIIAVRGEWPLLVAFIIFGVSFALVPLVDHSFLAFRKGGYVFHRSILHNGLRLPLVVVAASLGALGIFLAFGTALLIALAVSLLVLLPRAHPSYGVSPTLDVRSLRKMFHYAASNHLAGILQALPAGILPLLVLSRISPSHAAHFYVAWLMAGLLFVLPGSAATSLFVEGSHSETSFASDAVRSLRLTLAMLGPGVLGLFLAGPLVLEFFGRDFAAGGTSLLRLLAISAFFVVINSTYFAYLRVVKKVQELVILSAFLGAGIVILSYFLVVPFELLAPGIAFFSLQGLITAYIFIRNLSTSRRLVAHLVTTRGGRGEHEDRQNALRPISRHTSPPSCEHIKGHRDPRRAIAAHREERAIE